MALWDLSCLIICKCYNLLTVPQYYFSVIFFMKSGYHMNQIRSESLLLPCFSVQFVARLAFFLQPLRSSTAQFSQIHYDLNYLSSTFPHQCPRKTKIKKIDNRCRNEDRLWGKFSVDINGYYSTKVNENDSVNVAENHGTIHLAKINS